MIDKKHIEQFLHLNDLSAESSEEDIRTLLASARWHEDDITAALLVLNGSDAQPEEKNSSIHQLLNSDQKLKPETLSALLGIDVKVDSIITKHKTSLSQRYNSQIILIVLLSLLTSFSVLLFFMWFMEVGIFHEYAALKF